MFTPPTRISRAEDLWSYVVAFKKQMEDKVGLTFIEPEDLVQGDLIWVIRTTHSNPGKITKLAGTFLKIYKKRTLHLVLVLINGEGKSFSHWTEKRNVNFFSKIIEKEDSQKT